MLGLLLAVVLFSENGVTIEGDRAVDPARQLTIKVSPIGIDLRERFRGFSVADDYDDEKAGCTYWLITPEPCADAYKIAPFAFNGAVCGPVYFDPPPAREVVTGEMECDPRKDLPPLTLKFLGKIALFVAGAVVLLGIIWFAIRFLARKVKEHRMSPIERAWVELDRLIKKGLPGRGRYKDFYIELTMVVRRYIQRRYGIKAPHMTTEEFLCTIRDSQLFANHESRTTSHELKAFLESADMVKFAGVEATPEMADDATESARGYLKVDSAEASK